MENSIKVIVGLLNKAFYELCLKIEIIYNSVKANEFPVATDVTVAHFSRHLKPVAIASRCSGKESAFLTHAPLLGEERRTDSTERRKSSLKPVLFSSRQLLLILSIIRNLVS